MAAHDSPVPTAYVTMNGHPPFASPLLLMAQIFRANRRRDQRRPLPRLAVRLDQDELYQTRDWSLGGLALQGAVGRFTIGDVVNGVMRGAVGEGRWYGFTAEVVRVERGSGVAGLAFKGLSTEAYDFLEQFWRHPPAGA